MGNKLCSPNSRKRPDCRYAPYSSKLTDGHLLRVWATVYQNRVAPGHWCQVSETNVPVNISLIQDDPDNIFRVTAYSSLVEKVCDLLFVQPGTDLMQTSDTFITLTDLSGQRWGFNFTTANDTQKFKTICSVAAYKLEKATINGRKFRSRLRRSETVHSSGLNPLSASPVNVPPTSSSSSSQIEIPWRLGKEAKDGFCSLPRRSHKTSSVYDNIDHQQHNLALHRQRSTPQIDSVIKDDYVTHRSKPTVVSSVSFPSIPPLHAIDRDAILQMPEMGLTPEEVDEFSKALNSEALRKLLQPMTGRNAEEDTSTTRKTVKTNSISYTDEQIQQLTESISIELQSKLHAQSSPQVVVVLQQKSMDASSPDYPDSGIGGTASTHDSSLRGSIKSVESKAAIETNPSECGVADLAMLKMASAHHHEQRRPSNGDDHDHDPLLDDYSTMRPGSDDEEAGSVHSLETVPDSVFSLPDLGFGTTRKAGWLVVKNWLVRSKRKLELASKRKWKKYWVVLKSASLLFYASSEDTVTSAPPRHIISVEDGLAQPLPEHTKRDNIFCVSTMFGEAFLFEAPTQNELESWMTAIHSACVATLSHEKQRKENTLLFLAKEIAKIENQIETDIKMKNMGELQLNVVQDLKSRAAISQQIRHWEENIEKLNVDFYRLKCYLSSIQGEELPNPKSVLVHAARSTKAFLGKLGVFAASSFHAFVAARVSSSFLDTSLRHQRSAGNTSSNSSTTTGTTTSTSTSTSTTAAAAAAAAKRVASTETLRRSSADVNAFPTVRNGAVPTDEVRVNMPNQQALTLSVDDRISVHELLKIACAKRQLTPDGFFIRLKSKQSEFIPDKMDSLFDQEFDQIELSPKVIFQVELAKTDGQDKYGLHVEAELGDDADNEEDLYVFVSRVERRSIAEQRGLIEGDEILVIDGKVVKDLDMATIQKLLTKKNVCLTVRSCRAEKPACCDAMKLADSYIDQMTLPPPPHQKRISEKLIDQLIVPAPTELANGQRRSSQEHSNVELLLKKAEQVTAFCRTWQAEVHEAKQEEEPRRVKPLSEAQKLRKVILELVDTERAYVRDLDCVIQRYLEPLKDEPFLGYDEIEALFGNIKTIISFQRNFLKTLEDAIQAETSFITYNEAKQFKSSEEFDQSLRRILFSIAGTFIHYSHQFKLYSSFCASHSRAQRVLNAEDNSPLREFLRARNPKQQHSSTLESYLIKPIQRILKYPLLLQQLVNLTEKEGDEHVRLQEALRAIETVAEYINEMQMIYDEYGEVFEAINRVYKQRGHAEAFLSLPDICHHAEVEWLNPDLAALNLKSIRRSQDLATYCFVFPVGVLLVSRPRGRPKKKMGHKLTNGSTSDLLTECVYAFVPIEEAEVRNSAGTLGQTIALSWQLIHTRSDSLGRPEAVYCLASRSPESKQEVVRLLRQLGRSSQHFASSDDVIYRSCRQPRSSSVGREPFKSVGRARGTILQKQSTSSEMESIYDQLPCGRQHFGDTDEHSIFPKCVSQLLPKKTDHRSKEKRKSDCQGCSGCSSASSNGGGAATVDDLPSPIWKPRSGLLYEPPASGSSACDCRYENVDLVLRDACTSESSFGVVTIHQPYLNQDYDC